MKLFRKIHLWLSVPFGIFITLICFSGAMLVFEPEITDFFKNYLYTDSYVNSVGITVKNERLPFFITMIKLHRWLLADSTGKMIVGISTIVFIFALVTGIILWWPRAQKNLVRSLSVNLKSGWYIFWKSLHVAGGMYVVIFLLAIAFTGLTWSFEWYRTAFYSIANCLDSVSYGELRRIIYAVHTGSWGGFTTRVLWFAVALTGATLPLTGYYIWFKRMKRG